MNLLFCLVEFDFMVLNDSFDFYTIGFELFGRILVGSRSKKGP